MIKMLTTQNLILSPPRQDDLSGIKGFEDRPQSLKKMGINQLDKQFVQEEVQKPLENWIKECEEEKSVRFFIRLKADSNKILGFCNFTQVFHGAFQACYLGYKIDYEYEGKRLVFEALEASNMSLKN